jgi:DNA modification methylase
MPKNTKLVCHIKPYIQPFERKLAIRELQQLSGVDVVENSTDINCFTVYSNTNTEYLIDKLSYWESIEEDDKSWTKQLKREATTGLLRNGIKPSELTSVLPFKDDIPIPNRRCLRYGPHDAHEYRGKFFPQLVRALINLSELPIGSTILDPMCGSGTTLVEASLSGYSALGLDLNPLSVFISRTKCEIIHETPENIINEYEKVKSGLLKKKLVPDNSLKYFRSLPQTDQHYLESWFSQRILYDLDAIASLLDDMPPCASKNLFWLCLSNILRLVSYQKTDDLRVRREIKNDDIDAVAEFVGQLNKTVKYIVSLLLEEHNSYFGPYSVIQGDARELGNFFVGDEKPVDAVITSPPYATALPYLDTDRLSLSYLKLLPRDRYKATDSQMIGNREISETQRKTIWEHYLNEQKNIPKEINSVISEVSLAYQNNDVGFRRKNLPALLSKYFLDMQKVLAQVNCSIKKDGHIFIVVGDNHTIAHEKRINIETSKLVGILGQSVGMRLVESIPMEMLTPRNIFKKNAVASEYIVHFIADC